MSSGRRRFEQAKAQVVDTSHPQDPSAKQGDSDDAAVGLREVLRLTRALGRIADEAELFELILATARGSSIATCARSRPEVTTVPSGTRRPQVLESKTIVHCGAG